MSYYEVRFKLVPTDEECCINAVQIGKIIDEPPSTVREWANDYIEYLYIKKINGRFGYTKESVGQFKFIKYLLREKNFTHKQVLDQIINHGFEYNFFGNRLDEIGVTEEDYYSLLDIVRKQSEDIVNAIRNQILEELLERFKEETNKIAEFGLGVMNKTKDNIDTTLNQTNDIIEGQFNDINKKFDLLLQQNDDINKKIDLLLQQNNELNNKNFLNKLFGH